MGFFSKIADRIFGSDKAKVSKSPTPTPTGSTPAPVIFDGSRDDPTVSPPAPPAPTATPAMLPKTTVTAVAPPAEPVDVEAVLTALAEEKGGKSDWRRSIVDLLKLLDLDSDLAARKELAEELGVSAGAHGSAEQNIALHRAVMRKLAENGGRVPDDLKD